MSFPPFELSALPAIKAVVVVLICACSSRCLTQHTLPSVFFFVLFLMKQLIKPVTYINVYNTHTYTHTRKNILAGAFIIHIFAQRLIDFESGTTTTTTNLA